MQVNDLTSIDPNVDYTKILPIQQKRTIAFINHFVMNTVSFLNHFAQSCESRLMEFDYKLQQVEASLLILESQLASIPHLDDSDNNVVNHNLTKNESTQNQELNLPPVKDEEDDSVEKVDENDLVVDPSYQKFFKMLQFGVPAAAVKMKMQLEGLDPNVLDGPHPPKHSTKEASDN